MHRWIAPFMLLLAAACASERSFPDTSSRFHELPLGSQGVREIIGVPLTLSIVSFVYDCAHADAPCNARGQLVGKPQGRLFARTEKPFDLQDGSTVGVYQEGMSLYAEQCMTSGSCHWSLPVGSFFDPVSELKQAIGESKVFGIPLADYTDPVKRAFFGGQIAKTLQQLGMLP